MLRRARSSRTGGPAHRPPHRSRPPIRHSRLKRHHSGGAQPNIFGGAIPSPPRHIDMSREHHDSATLSRAAHLPPCRPAPTTLATPPPTPPTKPTTTPTARSSARGAAHRTAAYRAREHLRGPPSGLPSGPKSPSGADSSGSMRTDYSRKGRIVSCKISALERQKPAICGPLGSGGPRSRTWRNGFGDHRVTDTPVPRGRRIVGAARTGRDTAGRGRRPAPQPGERARPSKRHIRGFASLRTGHRARALRRPAPCLRPPSARPRLDRRVGGWSLKPVRDAADINRSSSGQR